MKILIILILFLIIAVSGFLFTGSLDRYIEKTYRPKEETLRDFFFGPVKVFSGKKKSSKHKKPQRTL